MTLPTTSLAAEYVFSRFCGSMWTSIILTTLSPVHKKHKGKAFLFLLHRCHVHIPQHYTFSTPRPEIYGSDVWVTLVVCLKEQGWETLLYNKWKTHNLHPVFILFYFFIQNSLGSLNKNSIAITAIFVNQPSFLKTEHGQEIKWGKTIKSQPSQDTRLGEYKGGCVMLWNES